MWLLPWYSTSYIPSAIIADTKQLLFTTNGIYDYLHGLWEPMIYHSLSVSDDLKWRMWKLFFLEEFRILHIKIQSWILTSLFPSVSVYYCPKLTCLITKILILMLILYWYFLSSRYWITLIYIIRNKRKTPHLTI